MNKTKKESPKKESPKSKESKEDSKIMSFYLAKAKKHMKKK